MKVIKKDRRIQSFDITKVRSSILGASIDSNTIINESDLKIISSRVLKELKELRGEDGLSSTYEIFSIIVECLNKDGFEDISKSYFGYKSEISRI